MEMSMTTDEGAVRAIHREMIEAWNAGSAARFTASFTENADFVAFEGTHMSGHREILAFHTNIFDTVTKGSRLEGEVKFVRFLNPELAVVHGVVRVTLAGQTVSSPSRDSMQLSVHVKRDGQWYTQELMNARSLTIERQFLLDDIVSLSGADHRQLVDVVNSLKAKTSPR